MSDGSSYFPRLAVVPPSKANGSHEDSFSGESPSASAEHQVKLLEVEAVELRKNIAKLLNDLSASQAEATEWRRLCNTGMAGTWAAPFEVDRLRSDLLRIREERDELRRQVDCLHTPEEMAEAVVSSWNNAIEGAMMVVEALAVDPNRDSREYQNTVLGRAVAAIRALKRSTSEKAP